ncbi:hypothetical protein BDQ12DRAFT_500035 [Crucibulum laeve]|uniref:Uncharacterized protein n=1 Tax=Crucibulum laeve TaxID=68775 RepID=A0A5C3LV13_9AGAR|nr:hypothetical protein BDQ12DRAFT_500035 [Crucibulum laeve]
MAHACSSISTTITTTYDTPSESGLTHSLDEPSCIGLFINAQLLPILLNVLPHTQRSNVMALVACVILQRATPGSLLCIVIYKKHALCPGPGDYVQHILSHYSYHYYPQTQNEHNHSDAGDRYYIAIAEHGL